MPLEGAEAELLAGETAGRAGRLGLDLRSPRGGPVMVLDVRRYAAVQAVAIDEERIEPPESDASLWSLTCYGVPPEGFRALLEIDPAQEIEGETGDQTWELTPDLLDELGMTIQPRTADMMPMVTFDHGTVVVRTRAP